MLELRRTEGGARGGGGGGSGRRLARKGSR